MMEKMLKEEGIHESFLGEVDTDVSIWMMFDCMVDSKEVSDGAVEVNGDF